MPTTKRKEQPVFTPRVFAVYRQVWTLTEEEHQELDRNFMLKTTGGKLHSLMNMEHEYKDFILNNGIAYELIYIDCGHDSLQERLADKPLLLSFRYNRSNNLAVCLVREPYRNANLSIYQEL